MAEARVNGVSLFYQLAEPGRGGGAETRADTSAAAAGASTTAAAAQDADTVAFLNGVMASANSWDAYTGPFAAAGYRILLHDFRGQLQSEKPEGPYSFSDHVQDFVALLDHLGIDAVHVVGTSYGGEIGMRLALDAPKRVKSLVLIDSVSELDGRVTAFVDSWIALARLGDPELFYRGVIPSLYSPAFLEAHGAMIEARLEKIRQLPPEYFRGQIELYEAFKRDVTMSEELHRIACPALVVCGEADILKPVEFSRVIAERIPNARLVTILGAGHVSIFEAPETIRSLALGFLADLPDLPDRA
jgi:3-oxoadipate enol-lactonase